MAVISKGEFAKVVGRTPAAVSQWISAGKLYGAALIGHGRFAQINVDVALQQLGQSLNLSQQLAQSRPIMGAGTSADDSDQARLLRAKAEREELALEMDRAKAEEMRGHWMVAREAEEAWARQLACFIQAVESWLVSGAAADVAALEHPSVRDVAQQLRAGFRTLRQRLADQAARAAAEMDPTEEDADGEDIAEDMPGIEADDQI